MLVFRNKINPSHEISRQNNQKNPDMDSVRKNYMESNTLGPAYNE